MGDFTSGRGGHGLREGIGRTHQEDYDGCPQPYDNDTQTGGASRTAGPHHSNLANKADPRVDSDRDGRGLGQGAGGPHTAGPHHSDLANKGDPRVDSDRDGRGLGAGAGTGRVPHTSGAGNTLDPRVDSGNPGRHGGTGHLGGTDGSQGNVSSHATGTGGVTHKKPSLLDRLNPTKDSDGDGKKGFMK